MKTIQSTVAFQSPQGVVAANGYLVMTLAQNCEIIAGGGQVFSLVPVVIKLDATGKIPAGTQIWANDELTPSCFYNVDLQDSNRSRLDNLGQWVISGASPIDVAQIIPSSTSPSFSDPVLLNPGVNQTIISGSLSITGGGSFNGPIGGLSPNTISATTGTFSGAITSPSVNGVIDACKQAGADLGAKINAAIAACPVPPCNIYVDSPCASITTAPNVPRGFVLEFATGTYTLSTEWPIYHRNTHYYFNNAIIQYTRDAGLFALQLGKASAYTNMNCSVQNGSPTVTWVSGGLGSFGDVDPGDVFVSQGVSGNILSVVGNTITLTANYTGATNANIACVVYLTSEDIVDTNFAPITFDDVMFQYTGAGTNAANGILSERVMTGAIMRNVRTANFTKGTAYSLVGTILGQHYNLTCGNVQNCFSANQVTLGGLVWPSNNNLFYGFRATDYNGASGNACNQVFIGGNSTGTTFFGLDLEYNQCTEVIRIQDTATGTIIRDGCRFEGNGDGTVNSRDAHIAGTASYTEFHGCYHTSGVTGNPNTGYQFDAGTASSTIENEKFNVAAGTPYVSCWNFAAGAIGRVINCGCPTAFTNPTSTNRAIEDQTGNYTINSLIVDNAGATAINVTGGGIQAGGVITTLSGFKPAGGGTPQITGDGTNVILPQTKISGAVLGNSGNLLISQTAPTIAAGGCGGAAATIATNNGTSAFTINVGTTPTAAGCVVGMPTAINGWVCHVTDITTNSTSVFVQKQTAAGSSTTQVTLVNYNDVAVATAPTASDIWQVNCFAR